MSGHAYNPSTNSTLPAKNLAEVSSRNDKVYSPSSGDLGHMGIASLGSEQPSTTQGSGHYQTSNTQHGSSLNSQKLGHSEQSTGSQGTNFSQNSSIDQSHNSYQHNSQNQGQNATDNKPLEAQTLQSTQGSEEEKLNDHSNLKMAAGIGGGILAAAGAAVGGYYLHEKKKASKQKQEEEAYMSNKQNFQNAPSLSQTNKPTKTEGINGSTGSYETLGSGHSSGHQAQGGVLSSGTYPTSGLNQSYGGLREPRDSGFASSNSGLGSHLQDELSNQQVGGSNLGSLGQSIGSHQLSGDSAFKSNEQGQFRN